jgi:hypothetical protein
VVEFTNSPEYWNISGSGPILIRYKVLQNQCVLPAEETIRVRWSGPQQGQNIVIKVQGCLPGAPNCYNPCPSVRR